MNEVLFVQPIGPNGVYGKVTVSVVDGQLVSSVVLSPAAVLNAAAAKIGGAIPVEVATFLEASIGLK